MDDVAVARRELDLAPSEDVDLALHPEAGLRE